MTKKKTKNHRLQFIRQTSISYRATVIFFFFFFWSLVVIWRLSHFMIFDRDHYLEEIKKESVTEASVPARRGAILDRNGRSLAWSTRHFALLWQVPRTEHQALEQWKGIQQHLVELKPVEPDRDLQFYANFAFKQEQIFTNTCSTNWILQKCGTEIVLHPDIPPAEIPVLNKVLEKYQGLQVRGYFVRHYKKNGRNIVDLGKVTQVNGTEIGVSGLEKAHDSLLRGQPGLYRVMHNRHGTWMPETWQSVREMRPGYDVHLPVQVPETNVD